MKKKLIISAAIVLLLLIGIYGYLTLREYRSYKQVIHKDAAFIVKVNLDGIFKTVVSDFIGNPGYYLGEGKERISRPERGLDLQANVFIYNFPEDTNRFFCVLPVDDAAVLKSYLEKSLGVVNLKTESKGVTTGMRGDGKLSVAFDDKNLAISFSFKPGNTKPDLRLLELLDPSKLWNADAPLIATLKHQHGHISWIKAQSSGQLNFKDGQMILAGLFPAGLLEPPKQSFSRNNISKDAVVQIWLNAGMRSALHRPFDLKGYHFEGDSLWKHFKGYADLEMSTPVIQKDTVISYEYNDDFEKVAIKKIQENRVPHLKLTLLSDASGLNSYLEKQGVVNGSGFLNKALFPLYQVQGSRSRDGKFLVFSTSGAENPEGALVPAECFFYARMNLEQLKEQQQFPLLNPYIEPFSGLEAKAETLEKGMVKLEIKVDFNRKNINAFSQLLKNLTL